MVTSKSKSKSKSSSKGGSITSKPMRVSNSIKFKKEDENDIDLITGGSGIVRKAKTIKKGKWKGHRAILYYNAANNSNNDSIVVVHYDREYGVGRHNYSSDFSLRSKNARVDAEEYYAGLQDL